MIIDAGNVMMGDIVKMESFQPIVQLTRHLIDQGMKRIGFLNESSSVYESMHERYKGYLYAMGRRMVQCFLWRIQHPDAPYEKIIVSGQVIIRKSSRRQ